MDHEENAMVDQGSGSSARLLGTPVHPPLTDVPIGAMAITAVLDVASAAGSGHTWAREVYRAGTFALMIGTAVLIVAIATGLADRSRTTSAGSEARSKVNVHALLMAAVGVVAVADILLRRQGYGDARHTPAAVLVVTVVLLVLTVAGGALGGKLVYRIGLGVSPGAGVDAPQAVTGAVVGEESADR
ncbi:MAG: hypothetical protein DLM59_04565 [Pseudonocardiales bacterium]|nr:MAG: hypothetical protein DLM59_04565 [Pseudonocardiales bacterium]